MDDTVAYIVVCWNNKNIISGCLDSIFEQTYKSKEVYLIDNNSSDGSAHYIETKYPKVKLIKSAHNYGFAKGNNILIKEALKDANVKYLALINSDAVLDTEWTSKIISFAKQKPLAAGLQGLTVDYYDHNLIDSHHVYLASNFQSVQYGYKTAVNKSSLFSQEVMGVNAAAAIYTRRFIEAQPFDNLFDETFFMYLEDVDVALRALLMGWKNYFVDGAYAYHMGSASSSKRSSDFSLYYTARNQFGLLVKNIPAGILKRNIFEFMNFERHFRRVLKEAYPISSYKAYKKGRLIGILRIPLYIAKRRQLKKLEQVDASFLRALMKGNGLLN